MDKVKRTYSLSAGTVATVRSLAAQAGVTQDAIVERSVDALRRRMRDAEHTAQWAAAARDPEFNAEMDAILAAFEADDAAAWAAGG